MERINFENNVTKANADTFNTLQDNIENAINSISINLDDEVSTTSTNGVENQAITNYIDNSIEDIRSAINGTILWTNSAPTSAFSAQTITLSSNDYDMLEIYYKKDPSSSVVTSVKILKGQSTILSINHISSNLYHRNRVMTYASDTSYTFDIGIQTPTNSSTLDQNAQYVIPLYIIGYKSGLFN